MFHALRQTLVSGFLILLPALLAYLMIGGLYDLIVALTTPLMDLVPRYGLLPAWGRQLFGIGAMLLACVGVGLARHTAIARRTGSWIENEIFGRFVPYRIVRDVTRQISGEHVPNMQGVLVPTGPDARTIGFLVEELPDGFVTVFIPSTSVPTIGQLRIMPRGSAVPVRAAFADSLGWYLNWGKGTNKLLEPAEGTATS